jgi:hypothetical protein
MRASRSENRRLSRQYLISSISALLCQASLLFSCAAHAGIMTIESLQLQQNFATTKPSWNVKIDDNQSAFVSQLAFGAFAQDGWIDPKASTLWFCHASKRLGMTCITTPQMGFNSTQALTSQEKSVRYVQAKHFKYYVTPNSRENPSEIDRITFNHQASGTQSKMLVMAK